MNNPWDLPSKPTPLADLLAVREKAREHSCSLESQELSKAGAEYELGLLKVSGWKYDPDTSGFYHPGYRDGEILNFGEAVAVRRARDYK